MSEQLVVKNIAKTFKYSYHTAGKTGDNFVGDLLESELGKKVDNLPLPDLAEINTELKTHWRSPKTTLKSIEPSIGSTMNVFYNYAYPTEDGRLKLNMTITVNKNKHGFYILADNKKIRIKKDRKILCSWDTREVIKQFKQKMPNLFFIKYDIQKKWLTYRDLISYKRITPKSVINLINSGSLAIEFRVSEQKNGSIKNRGTAFRLVTSKKYNIYDKLFSEVKTLIKDGVIVEN